MHIIWLIAQSVIESQNSRIVLAHTKTDFGTAALNQKYLGARHDIGANPGTLAILSAPDDM